MADVSSRFRDVWRELELRGQVTLVVSVVAVLATAFFLWSFAAHPSYATLASNLSAADSAEVTSALEGAGVAYRMSDGATSVSVPEGKLDAARVALARQGLPRGQHVGFEIFDKSSLGTSDFEQKVDYQRALEGEVARTIEQIDGVQQAEVQLVLPDETLFADESAQSSAAVLLTTSGLDAATIRGIAHLVASSVKGLAPDDVTITDSVGALLWPSSGTSGASTVLAAEQSYDAALAAQLNTLVASTLGSDKAQARVHATLSLDQTTIDKVTYGKKATPLQTQTDVETLKSKGGAASTPGATATKVPTYAGSNGASNSDYSHKTDASTMGVDKTEEHTTVTPGTVRRMDVALLVDQTVPAAQVTALKAAIAGAAGVDPTRGDTLTVSKISFAKQTAAAKAAGASPLAALGNPIALAKTVLGVLAALVFLFLVRRGLKKREAEGIVPEPTWLREIAAATPIAQLELGHGPARLALDAAAEQRASTRDELEELARTQPEQVAVQVQQWLKQ